MKRSPLALATSVVAAISCAASALAAASLANYERRLDRPVWIDWLIERTGTTPFGLFVALERYAMLAAAVAALAFAFGMVTRWPDRPGRRVEPG